MHAQRKPNHGFLVSLAAFLPLMMSVLAIAIAEARLQWSTGTVLVLVGLVIPLFAMRLQPIFARNRLYLATMLLAALFLVMALAGAPEWLAQWDAKSGVAFYLLPLGIVAGFGIRIALAWRRGSPWTPTRSA